MVWSGGVSKYQTSVLLNWYYLLFTAWEFCFYPRVIFVSSFLHTMCELLLFVTVRCNSVCFRVVCTNLVQVVR